MLIKRLIFLAIVIIMGLISCSSDENLKNDDYKFIIEYSSEVNVGGVVGLTERTFKIGEVYAGVDQGNGVIKIRIAEHSELNDDCSNSWCYQEFLNIPSEFLELVE